MKERAERRAREKMDSFLNLLALLSLPRAKGL
jgi:hypothetical protein